MVTVHESIFSGLFLTLSQTSPGFLCVCSRSLLKTSLEKEKLLVTFWITYKPVFPAKSFELEYLLQFYSTLTEISILYTDTQTNGQTDRQTDRLIPVYLQKHSLCKGYMKGQLTLSQTSPGFYVSAVQNF